LGMSAIVATGPLLGWLHNRWEGSPNAPDWLFFASKIIF